MDSYEALAPPPAAAGAAAGGDRPGGWLGAGGRALLAESMGRRRFEREELGRLAELRSIGYLPGNSAVYKRWLSRQPYMRQWDRWLMMGLIGLSTGFVGYAMYTLIDFLAAVKYDTLRHLVSHSVFLGWLFGAAYSGLLVAAAAYLVVVVAPQAAGSGVPETMAYLNGCQLRRIFNLPAFVVKFLSCSFAVAAGMPIGPEGPMIHLGAIVGAGLSQGASTTLGFSFDLFSRFREPKDKRDFITAGVAAGVATAFGAPLGGLLFTFEEIASFWQQRLGWHIFFACMCSILSLNLFRAFETAITEGHFGLFDHPHAVVFEISRSVPAHLLALLPAAIVGCACGLASVAFTKLHLWLVRLRARFLTTRSRQVLEPVVGLLVFFSIGAVIAAASRCVVVDCTVDPDSGSPHCEGPPGATIRRVVEPEMELFSCDSSGGGGRARQYNEFATLFFVTGEDSVRHLFSRETHREFSYGALIPMLLMHFFGSLWASGTKISAGMFVPMLLVGGCIGRIIGLLCNDIAAAGGHGSDGAPPGVFTAPSPYEWMDPGVFALVGAGAFMSGVSRLTISLAVIVMEMSNELHFMLPLILGIIVAKGTADRLCPHNLYHSSLEERCIPFLPHDSSEDPRLDLFSVRHLMASPVVSVAVRDSPSRLRALLQKYEHAGFPVVQVRGGGTTAAGGKEGKGQYVGFLEREHLEAILRKYDRGAGQVTYEDLKQRPSADPLLRAAQEAAIGRPLSVPLSPAEVAGGGASGPVGGAGPGEEAVDLSPSMDTSAFCVPESFSAGRAYTLFCALGLRALTVVDPSNEVVGVLTRKDLMPYRLEDAVEGALEDLAEAD